jgi:hypothetical protein
MANGSNYIKLEHRLVLLAWFNNLLGFKENKELFEIIKKAEEGYDPYGQSHIRHLINGLEDVRIGPIDLARYDENIKRHLDEMNKTRPEPITLRYFQFLAVLYTEIFLDWYFNHKSSFVKALNDFVAERNARKDTGEVPDSEFTEDDLTKLAYWMATGSGKTLIMHFNYRQFLHYNNQSLDNILLITPNEGLSEQHILEMRLSGIPCEKFNSDESGLGITDKNAVRVIEIHKLVEEKKGGGVSVDVECFQGNNLIFVDEGHKGSGGEAWKRFRDRLGETGFTFEYSATFGQALTAARNDELTAEYGKAIIFDYSYKYFYGDGYGKDFLILNLKEELEEQKTNVLLLANLLSYYEQKRCFDDKKEKLRKYNIETPLWIFVGSSVNAVYSQNKQKKSDILTIAKFFHCFLENKKGWACKTIEKILNGQTGLNTEDGNDLFVDKLAYLKTKQEDGQTLYSKILKSVFHCSSSGGLHLCDIRGSAGEIALKVGGSDDYFGLIYIGDTSAFKKIVEEDAPDITLEEDAISGTLFGKINLPDSDINILVGAKKFIEGWSSWRVSNMGLLNIGRSEGSSIIQLFGRGVRLLGLDRKLKRSTAIDGNHPEFLPTLETLNIFAIRANYMSQFRDYLEKEGVETEGRIELSLKIKKNTDFLNQGLLIPAIPDGRNFVDEYQFLLEPDTAAKVKVDLSLRVETLRSGKAGLKMVEAEAGEDKPIPEESLNLLDWEKVYLDLLEYKEQRGFSNMVVRLAELRSILNHSDNRLYSLIANDSIREPKELGDIPLLYNAVLNILRQYIEKYYYVCQQRWETETMVCSTLDGKHSNFCNYIIKIPKLEKRLIKAIEKLIKEGKRIYKQETSELQNVHFDLHLYQPLLVKRGEQIETVPPRLEPSEEDFVKKLRDYIKNKGVPKEKEIFLLRNLGRGKGIGFFDDAGVYPDFILWVKDNRTQRIIFIEPHGMVYEKAYAHSEKAKLHEKLKGLSQKINKRTGLKNVELDSFIVSETTFDIMQKKYDWDKKRFAESHILFREDEYIPQILSCVGIE